MDFQQVKFSISDELTFAFAGTFMCQFDRWIFTHSNSKEARIAVCFTICTANRILLFCTRSIALYVNVKNN